MNLKPFHNKPDDTPSVREEKAAALKAALAKEYADKNWPSHLVERVYDGASYASDGIIINLESHYIELCDLVRDAFDAGVSFSQHPTDRR